MKDWYIKCRNEIKAFEEDDMVTYLVAHGILDALFPLDVKDANITYASDQTELFILVEFLNGKTISYSVSEGRVDHEEV